MTVRTVGQDLEVHDLVVDAEDRPYIRPQRVLLVKDEDALVPDGRVQIDRYIQFGARTEHAVGFDATQLAFLDVLAAGQDCAALGHGYQRALEDVWRARYDLQHLVPYVHLADDHVIRIFMLDDGQDAAHDDVLHLCAHVLNALDAGAVHDHLFFIFRSRHRNVGVLFQPLHRYFHDDSPCPS